LRVGTSILGAFGWGLRPATVVAIGPVRALVVTHDRFTLFLAANPRANRAYRHVVTQRWYEVADMLRAGW
jgi:CRP-like cAMP-binding protein